MSEWKEVVLSKVTTIIADGLHGTPQFDDKGEYFFINGNNLNQGRIIIKSDTKRVNEEEAKKYAKPLSDKTILLSINGTIGNVALYNNEKCMLGKSACYINVNEENDRKFLYYVFSNRDFQSFIVENATGTTIPNVPLKGLREYTFNIPTLPEQKSIASILSSLDDKIDLLHRQNATLEKMAETLFKQWFVEEAKEDWEKGSLGDFVNIVYGKNLPTKNLLPSGYPVFGGNGQIGFFDKYIYENPQVLVSCRGEASGVVNISLKKAYVTNNSLILEIGKRPEITFEYLKYSSLYADFKTYVSGSAQPQITIEGLNLAEFVLPPNVLINRFTEVARVWEQKRTNNQTQISTLTALRDTLLPKLMSGEIRVEKELNNNI